MKNTGFTVFAMGASGAGITWMLAYASGFRSWWVGLLALIIGTFAGLALVGPRHTLAQLRMLPGHAREWSKEHQEALEVSKFTALILAFLGFSWLQLWGMTVLAVNVGYFGERPPNTVWASLLLGIVIFVVFLVAAIAMAGLDNTRKRLFRRHHYSAMKATLTRMKLLDRRIQRLDSYVLIKWIFLTLWPFSFSLIALVTVLQSVVLLLDFLRVVCTAFLNGVLRVAGTERLSAAEGVFTGGGVVLVRYWGTTEFLVPFLIAMALGGSVGLAVFKLRQLLISRKGVSRLAY